MCLAIPARVVEMQDADSALIDVGGVRTQMKDKMTGRAHARQRLRAHKLQHLPVRKRQAMSQIGLGSVSVGPTQMPVRMHVCQAGGLPVGPTLEAQEPLLPGMQFHKLFLRFDQPFWDTNAT